MPVAIIFIALALVLIEAVIYAVTLEACDKYEADREAYRNELIKNRIN